MAAAAVAVVAARKNRKRKSAAGNKKDGISFHLRLHLGEDASLPKGESSVGWIRSPLHQKRDKITQNTSEFPEPTRKSKKEKNLNHNIGTRFEVWVKKFNDKWEEQTESAKWQDRLLIVTERRLFVASMKLAKPIESPAGDAESIQLTDNDLEIVDSIPMEEIVSVELEANDDTVQWKKVFEPKPITLRRKLQEWFQYVAEVLSLKIRFEIKSEIKIAEARDRIEKIQEQLRSEEIRQELIERYCPRLIRIVTDPEGFNRGIPYYFVVKNDSYRSWKGTLDWKQARSGFKRTLSNWQQKQHSEAYSSKKKLDVKVAGKLKKLATNRRLEVKRETRFLRFQAFLQYIWNSKRFNLILLFLIVSNFVFTVQQLENTDPSRQRYFETIDLAYTIIFSIGEEKSDEFSLLLRLRSV
jgi:hypothetical protein